MGRTNEFLTGLTLAALLSGCAAPAIEAATNPQEAVPTPDQALDSYLKPTPENIGAGSIPITLIDREKANGNEEANGNEKEEGIKDSANREFANNELAKMELRCRELYPDAESYEPKFLVITGQVNEIIGLCNVTREGETVTKVLQIVTDRGEELMNGTWYRDDEVGDVDGDGIGDTRYGYTENEQSKDYVGFFEVGSSGQVVVFDENGEAVEVKSGNGANVSHATELREMLADLFVMKAQAAGLETTVTPAVEATETPEAGQETVASNEAVMCMLGEVERVKGEMTEEGLEYFDEKILNQEDIDSIRKKVGEKFGDKAIAYIGDGYKTTRYTHEGGMISVVESVPKQLAEEYKLNLDGILPGIGLTYFDKNYEKHVLALRSEGDHELIFVVDKGQGELVWVAINDGEDLEVFDSSVLVKADTVRLEGRKLIAIDIYGRGLGQVNSVGWEEAENREGIIKTYDVESAEYQERLQAAKENYWQVKHMVQSPPRYNVPTELQEKLGKQIDSAAFVAEGWQNSDHPERYLFDLQFEYKNWEMVQPGIYYDGMGSGRKPGGFEPTYVGGWIKEFVPNGQNSIDVFLTVPGVNGEDIEIVLVMPSFAAGYVTKIREILEDGSNPVATISKDLLPGQGVFEFVKPSELDEVFEEGQFIVAHVVLGTNAENIYVPQGAEFPTNK